MKVFSVNPEKPEDSLLEQAGEIVRNGGLVAFPTETVYGIAGSIENEQAINWLYDLKKRPHEKPFAFQFSSLKSFFSYVKKGASPFVCDFVQRFLPGPVTVVYFDKVLRTKIGVRIPDNTVTQLFLEKCRVPVFAPSANPAGRPSPINAKQVTEYFKDSSLDALIDAGPCRHGKDSTVVEISESGYSIFRQGALPEEEIAQYYTKK